MPIQSTIVVSAIISNGAGHYLLVRHHRRGWEPPGGRVEQGEDLFSAVIREVHEETGYVVEVGPLMGLYQNVSERSTILFVFGGRAVDGTIHASEETPEVAWFSADEASELISGEGTRARFKDLLAYDGRTRYHAFTPNTDIEAYRINSARFLS